jgi:3-mercaptopyruvate sulfurtransferase SseA
MEYIVAFIDWQPTPQEMILISCGILVYSAFVWLASRR